MKAAVFHKKHELRYEAVPKPLPADDEVLIQIKACGVCGTDVHIYEGAAGSAVPKPDTILGHEFSGVVLETGKAVKNIKTEDRVTVNPNLTCGKCHYCRNGQEHFCENMLGLGTTANGGFAEYCTAKEKIVYKVGDELSFEQAAMSEPVACCLHGLDLAQIKAGDTVMIIGGGTIGMIMLQLARISGAARIILSEPVAAKRELGLKLGADKVVNPLDECIEDILRDNNIIVNVGIECVGNPKTMLDTIKYTGKGGHVMLFGLTSPECEIPVKPYEIFQKELTIRASFINPYTQERAIALLESGRINIDDLIYRNVNLRDIEDVFENKLYAKGKIIVCP
ncbi:MAG: zinc-dependent alcohol dehydrogenase family protein [Bacillota bacterium]|nr:zinc-dependent alcohol dehydrogenase family protein [Bacillota bacterium]